MPLGLTVASDFIYQAYVSDDKMKTFFHGHSYTANPVACSAANASLDLFDGEEVKKQIDSISKAHLTFAKKITGHQALRDVRVLGTILAMELNTAQQTEYLNPAAEKISEWFLAKGIILRPLGNIFYVLPPYCISMEDLEYLYSQIENFLKEC